MTFSAGVGAGVCGKAPKAATSAAAQPTAFQPANMRIIFPLVFAPVYHGPRDRWPPLTGYYVALHSFISTQRNTLDAARLTEWRDSVWDSPVRIRRGRAALTSG